MAEFTVPTITLTPTHELPLNEQILTAEQWAQFITDLEHTFWEKGEYIKPHELAPLYRITLEQAESLYLKANPVLAKRGLPQTTRHEVQLQRDQFDPMFVLAVNKLTDPMDKRSNAVKLKEIGVSTKSFQAYLKDDKSRSYYERRLNEAFDQGEYAAKTSLLRNIESGDLNSIKYFNEWTGRFQSTDSTAFNFIAVLQKVMEILAKHVDQNTLDVLATEFEKEITSGL